MKNERLSSGKTHSQPEGEKILQKLPFRITEVSSQEEDYPVTELLNHTPFSKGWTSSKFCDYPQEITLCFPSSVNVKQIQFLSHQFKISTKIEISISSDGNRFKRIGYLSLDSNERSNFKARELKSVHVDYVLNSIKISLLRCHTNKHNTFLQVGLIALNVLGDYMNKSDSGLKDNININNYFEGATKLEDEMNFDPSTLKRLKALYKAKEKAVELEDFDEAKKIKEAIERLKGVSQQLIQLEERKRIAIRNDDFDAAKMLKYEVERLRNAVVGIQISDQEAIGMYSNNLNNSNINNNHANRNVYKKPIKEDYDYQRDEDQLPQGREKIKLMPVNKTNKEEIPLTSDLLLDQEDPINMTKKVNPNQGYKLKDRAEIKQKIDVENQVIKGMNKDFSEIVNEKLQDRKSTNKNVDQEIEDDIPAAEFKRAEPLIPVLSYDIVKMLFSKYWRNKEEGIKILVEEIGKHPHSELLSSHGADKILVAIVGASASVLTCNVSQALMATMDMLKILFNKFRGTNIGGYLRGDFDNYVDQCMLSLIEKVGDSNLKLKEKAENTVMEFANSTLVGHKTVFEDLITGQVKKTLVKSARHIAGRLNLISRMIENFGLNDKDVPIDTLITYAVNAFKDPNKEVRDASYNLLMNIYKYVGDDIRKHFKDLRQAQISLLEEGFDNLDGLNQRPNQQEEQEFMNESQMMYEQNQNNKKDNKNQNKNQQSKTRIFILNLDSFQNEEDNQFNQNNANEAQSCGICGHYDPNFDDDSLHMHWFRECPMLCLCFRCKQMVEIPSLNYHFQNECEFKKEFKQCSRCKESFHQSEYTQHVAEKMCIPAKSPNVANRCPLCHTDNTPAGKVGWEVHLLQNSCPNNPRTNG